MTEILGREPEIAAMNEFLDGRGADARALVLEGEPGIGKTTLWRWAVSSAERRGVNVLRAQPTEAEHELPFATLADVLAEVHDEIRSLPEPQRRALRIALLLEESDGRRLDERMLGTALASLLREIARNRTVLVAIDDIQWADPSSWACIRFALRRLDLGVAALVTCRSGLELDSHFLKLALGTLADAAIRELAVRAGDGMLSGDDVERVAKLAGGHPLYALEIVRERVARRRDGGRRGERSSGTCRRRPRAHPRPA